MADDASPEAIRKAVTLYASFNKHVAADFGGGKLEPVTRTGDLNRPGEFVFEPGIDKSVFRIAADKGVRGKGVRGGALEVVDVLPHNGRIFFPARGNIAYRDGGWGGAVSFWLNTDPNTLLKTPFCDPVQITEKGAGNGGVWCDFPDVKPRDFRLGAFPAVPPGEKPIPESSPQAPLVRVEGVGFKSGVWHHVVLNWNHFDTGRPNAEAALYIDGKLMGRIHDRAIAMNWNLEKTGIYFAVNYIGLLDELAVFERPLTDAEITALGGEPSLLSSLESGKRD